MQEKMHLMKSGFGKYFGLFLFRNVKVAVLGALYCFGQDMHKDIKCSGISHFLYQA